MGEILIIITVTSGAFISTNLDNLVLLVAFYSRYRQQSGLVTAGYFAGMSIIAVIVALIGEVGDFIPLSYLGLLGVVPMLIGVFALWQLVQNKPSAEVSKIVTGSGRFAVFFSVLTTQLGNGADSIITFSILVAESSDATDYLIAPIFLAMVGVFSWVAIYSLNHPGLSRFLDRYGKYLTPFILILVGFYILSDTASDLVPV